MQKQILPRTTYEWIKYMIAGGFRISTIAVLCACTTVHPETISQNLGPEAQDKFQRDFAECHEFAESKRPKVSFKDDIGVPLSVVFLSALVGVIVESNSNAIRHIRRDDYGDPKYGGKAIIGFSLAGVVAASWIVVAGMKSRQDEQDTAQRACLFERGYTVP
jgi:uncharacterized membrane protein YcjF (UPF0283 family)